jgi:TRAP-type C4-dicarboxylate transport system substrate-binding protein
MAETYQMLQRGVVDGSAHPVEANNGWKLGEVSKYMIQNFSSGYTTTFAVFMNQKRWHQLTREQQEIITRINKEYALKHGQAWDQADEKGMAFFLSKGGTVISQTDEESSRWAQKVSILIQDYIQAVAKRGIDGKPIVDFIQSLTAKP